MRIEPVDPCHPEVLDLITALDDYQNGLYPCESNHLDGIDTLKQTNVMVAAALDSANRIMGIGAVKFMDGYGEIKRMFVPQSHRKKGVAQRILQALENHAMAGQLPCLRLETGIHQQAAISLYRSAGFRPIGPFGNYTKDPLSLFMEKPLSCFSDRLAVLPYTPKDRDQVIAIWQTCELTVPWNDPDNDIQRKRDDSPELFFLARMKDQIIGTCMAGYDGHRGWLYYLGVDPAFRNNGVAKALIQHGEAVLAELGCPKINLMVRKTNSEVIGFYHGQGYKDDPVMVLSKRIIPDI